MGKSTDRKLTRKHVSKDILGQIGLDNIYRTFHPNAEEYTFFSSTQGTFSRKDHTLGHKSTLG